MEMKIFNFDIVLWAIGKGDEEGRVMRRDVVTVRLDE